MTTMIRTRRSILAALLLTAVMSFPTTSSGAATESHRAATAIEGYQEAAAILRHGPPKGSTRVCPIDWRRSSWHVQRLIKCAAAHWEVPGGEQMALAIAWRESRFQHDAYNSSSGAAGIYQHLLKYWPDRAYEFGFATRSPFDARANIIVTMKMVKRYGWWPWSLPS